MATNKFWNFIKNEANAEEVELHISGEIVDDTYAWIYEWFGIPAASPNAFREELKSYAGKNITVWIDSWGGSSAAAAGIYDAMKNHNGKVTVKITKAVSAASVIAMSGDEIWMSPVGIFMIHNPWTETAGESRELRRVADVLDVIKDTIMNAYQMKTGKEKSKISQMMDDETWMSAKTAKSEGFVDGILYSSESTDPAIENSFMFSSMAIQNSASADMKRFIEQYRAGEINSLGQEKQTDEKAASGLGALIASALSSLIPKNKTEEVQTLEIKNAGDLKNAYPDMVNQITADAVTVERGRVTALDAIDDPSNAAVHELVVDAKASGKTAEDIKSAVDIMKKHTADADAKNKGAEAMKKVVNDSKASGVDGVDADAGEGQSEQQETAAVVNTMAGVLNKMGGKK